MKNLKQGIKPLLFAFVGAFIALWAYSKYFKTAEVITVKESQPVQLASYSNLPGDLPDLSYAAENSVHAVVHIKVTQKGSYYYSSNPLLDWMFGNPGQRQEVPIKQGSGSGVIISADGTIVTNNHVIDEADEITVILNDKREFDAKLIGTDPQTDIAVLKIDAKDLPYLRYGDSENLKLGQWVLAVGNPFNLTSTVTAGIISAKGRSIGINQDVSGIESFIQTDAAVNPGNSGGALVNMQGELIGINTAIASQTGSYSGYSFAVPVTIVKKVVDDILEYGETQRALMGVEIQDVDAKIAKEQGLDKIEGVFIEKVNPGGAKEAGIQAGDIVTRIDGVTINSRSHLQEQVSKHRPGDVIQVTVKRDNKEKLFTVKLRNRNGNTGIVKNAGESVLGAKFEPISETDMKKLGITNGLKITELTDGKLKSAGISKGFIIVDVNKNPVNSVKELNYIIERAHGGILIEGIYPNGEEAYYVFGQN